MVRALIRGCHGQGCRRPLAGRDGRRACCPGSGSSTLASAPLGGGPLLHLPGGGGPPRAERRGERGDPQRLAGPGGRVRRVHGAGPLLRRGVRRCAAGDAAGEVPVPEGRPPGPDRPHRPRLRAVEERVPRRADRQLLRRRSSGGGRPPNPRRADRGAAGAERPADDRTDAPALPRDPAHSGGAGGQRPRARPGRAGQDPLRAVCLAGRAHLHQRPLARSARGPRPAAARLGAGALGEPAPGPDRTGVRHDRASDPGLGGEPSPRLRGHLRGPGGGHSRRRAGEHEAVRADRRAARAAGAGRGAGVLHSPGGRRGPGTDVRRPSALAVGPGGTGASPGDPGPLPSAEPPEGAWTRHRSDPGSHGRGVPAGRRADHPAATAPPLRAGAGHRRDPLPHRGGLHPRLGVLAPARRVVRVPLAGL